MTSFEGKAYIPPRTRHWKGGYICTGEWEEGEMIFVPKKKEA